VNLEPRTHAPAHATGAVEFVPLAAVAGDATFRLRDEGDVAALAASIGRLGQLAPVELRRLPGTPEGAPRYQVISGFRRVAALRMLLRERVLARVHASLPDEDAWAIALVQPLLTEPLDAPAVEALRERLAGVPHAAWADELLEEALVRAPVTPEQRERFYQFLGGAPAPEEEAGGEEAAAGAEVAGEGEAPDQVAGAGGGEDDAVEVTPEELAQDLAARMWETNEDLAALYEAWSELSPEERRLVVAQARYVAELYPLIAEEDDE